uniref:Chemokine interleukin-8-like domain-containing protein n=1 Tax=Scleropages formosus TaxID=113540 RepID=A0A8C9V508_SCLFO
TMKAEIILLCVIIFGMEMIQIMTGGRSQTCLCNGKLFKEIRLKRIQDLKVFTETVYCLRIEIVVTDKKTGEKLCLNPNAKQGKIILQKLG